MMENLIQPTEEQFEQIRDELEGCSDDFGRTHKRVLTDLGLDIDLRDSVIYNDTLETYIFLCENCDCWCSPDTRIHNQIAEMTVCEECDEQLS
jgi:hypothetical protein